MDYTIIIRPLIGAGIGYVTNWIAVKMLFRPLKEYRIGKLKIPFTPGIIPKNKSRIAESIGLVINDNLLTEETLRENLLSDEIKLEIRDKITNYLNSISSDDTLITKDFLCSYIDSNIYETSILNITNHLSNSIYDTIKKSNLGDIIAEQIELSAREKLKGSFLGMLGGNSIISSISETASIKINEYIDNNGKQLVYDMVTQEINKFSNSKLSDLANSVNSTNNSEINIVDDIIMDLYEKFILNKLSNLLKTINISKIVSDKIKGMDTLELEKIILEIMKKELNALVSLGALIGFILGLLNLLF